MLMENWLARQDMLIGREATERLAGLRVAVIGLGGVGGACFEALARCGVGGLLAWDFDVVDATNLNRQLLATIDAVGRPKADLAKRRAAEINPAAKVETIKERFGEETKSLLSAYRPDFVVDAIDMVSAKLLLIETCKKEDFPVVSSMGTGNRLTADFAIGDVEGSAGNGDPLARVMRKELQKRGISGVTALYSRSAPIHTGERTPGSVSFVPPVAGYLIAGYVARELIGIK